MRYPVTSQLPLEGIRIIDSTYVFALPYAAALLADLGAEVIKVEGPGRHDVTRTGGYSGMFPEGEHGEDWWNRPSTYNLLHRGKRSLVLDLTDERGRDLFRQLVSISDVVMENFTPRVMRGWGMDYLNLRKIKPDIVMVSNTGYGHGGGPYSGFPAQATTQEATHGHCWFTGYSGGAPSKAGASFVDFLSTWTAVFGIAAALRYRNRTGQGQWVDIGMYQAGVMFASEYILDGVVNGREGGRTGNRHPYRAPQGCYPAQGDDRWIALSVGSDEQWQALCRLMGREDLAGDARYADLLSRQRHHDELDQAVSAWTAGLDRYDLMHRLQAEGIPAGPVLNGKDMHFDPHYKSRGFLERVSYPPERGIGTRMFIGRPYKFSRSPVKIQGPAPSFGQDNQATVQDLLGVDETTYQALVQDAVVATVPLRGDPANKLPPEQAVEKGLLAGWDPEYRQRLGIQ
jgi:crotonobetainyl-CoA:carnitine CoA-transferase CaiB-like acyl-CoA transferase